MGEKCILVEKGAVSKMDYCRGWISINDKQNKGCVLNKRLQFRGDVGWRDEDVVNITVHNFSKCGRFHFGQT